MRQYLVAGNWKMHGSKEAVAALVEGVTAGTDQAISAEVALCPPFVFLSQVGEMISESRVVLGAQNVSEYDKGAYTGEVSGQMLIDFGCTYAIVGHSERRAIYRESDDQVANKFQRARTEGLRPILCVGETLEERESNQTQNVIARQLGAVLDTLAAGGLDDAVIAYEPVWAIGTGKTATPEMANDVHKFIRERLHQHSSAAASRTRILYGGSVKSSNAQALFAMPDIDGGLIGGASLQADEFLAICSAATD